MRQREVGRMLMWTWATSPGVLPPSLSAAHYMSNSWGTTGSGTSRRLGGWRRPPRIGKPAAGGDSHNQEIIDA